MSRPDDVLFRARVGTFALLRSVLPLLLLVSLLVWPMFVFDPPLAGVLGWAGLFIGLFVLWVVRDVPLYQAHTFGIEERLDDTTFDGPRTQCVACSTACTQGLRRRYTRQFVCFGVPIHTLEWGANDYCPECTLSGDGLGVHSDAHEGNEKTNSEGTDFEFEGASDRS